MTAAPTEHLARGLKNRHIQMIALGGAIGTGLFYGSAASINLVGPGIIVSYLIGGAIMYMIMRMMGEMSTQEPVSGAFSHFAYKYWGKFPGFLAGWKLLVPVHSGEHGRADGRRYLCGLLVSRFSRLGHLAHRIGDSHSTQPGQRQSIWGA